MKKFSTKLVVANLNWKKFKAFDLYIIFKNFLNRRGNIRDMFILQGLPSTPILKIKNSQKLDFFSYSEKNDNLSKLNISKKNSAFQKNNKEFAYLKCDSVRAAKILFKNFNGLQLDFSENLIDIRFVSHFSFKNFRIIENVLQFSETNLTDYQGIGGGGKISKENPSSFPSVVFLQTFKKKKNLLINGMRRRGGKFSPTEVSYFSPLKTKNFKIKKMLMNFFENNEISEKRQNTKDIGSEKILRFQKKKPTIKLKN